MKLFNLTGADGQPNGSNPTLQKLVLDNMRSAAPLFEFLEFYSMLGSADTPTKDVTPFNNGAYRTLNNDFTGTDTAAVLGSVALKIFGDKVKTDRAWERRGAKQLGSERARQLAIFAQSLARYFTGEFINGAGAPNAMSGLSTLVPVANVLNFDTANGGEVPLGNTTAEKKQQQKYLEALDNLIDMIIGGADVLIMNRKNRARLKHIGRDLVSFQTMEDALGKKYQVTMYNGVPVLDAGYNADLSGTIIGNTETLGNSGAVCTSVYAAKFGEKSNLTAASNVGVVVKDEGLVGSQYVTSVELDANLVLLNDYSLAQLNGIILP